jgi:putative FmdB family regulatory protein
MPTYEYKCDACQHAFEKFHSITAAPIKQCPECGKKKVKRLIGTGAGLIFKGSGFYCTDYRSQGYKDAAKSDAGKSESKTETKAENKSGSKSESKAAAAAPAPAAAKPAKEAAAPAK